MSDPKAEILRKILEIFEQPDKRSDELYHELKEYVESLGEEDDREYETKHSIIKDDVLRLAEIRDRIQRSGHSDLGYMAGILCTLLCEVADIEDAMHSKSEEDKSLLCRFEERVSNLDASSS